jgi:hypothetical protein
MNDERKPRNKRTQDQSLSFLFRYPLSSLLTILILIILSAIYMPIPTLQSFGNGT